MTVYTTYTSAKRKKLTITSIISYGKFGKSTVEKFLKPYNEKLYAIDLTKLLIQTQWDDSSLTCLI